MAHPLKILQILDVGEPCRRRLEPVREADGVAVSIQQLNGELSQPLRGGLNVAGDERHDYGLALSPGPS